MMARYRTESVLAALEPHLRPGETLEFYASGVRHPNPLLVLVLLAMGILPGIDALMLLPKRYVVGLTDTRLLVLHVKGRLDVVEVSDYARDAMPETVARSGPFHTHIRIADEARPFAAHFHRAGMDGNRANAIAIGDALGR